MASSRWKRFAFFDRNNLPLPPSVLEDLLPPTSPLHEYGKSISSPSRGGSRNMNMSSNSSISSNMSAEDGEILQSARGELVSLVVTSGASVSAVNLGNASKNPEGKDSTASTSAVSSSNGTSKMGVEGMLHSLQACSRASGNSTRQGPDASTDTAAVPPPPDVIPFSPAGEIILNRGAAGALENSRLDNTMEGKNGSRIDVEGPNLVLTFLSSRFTQMVHCVDLTGRCNPISRTRGTSTSSASSSSLLRSGDDGSNSKGNVNSAASTTSFSEMSAGTNKRNAGNSLKEVEDLDGWRGSFHPFAHGILDESGTASAGPSVTTSTSTASKPSSSSSNTNVQMARIVGIAVCSSHATIPKSNTATANSSPRGGKNIYLACITDAPNTVAVAVIRNPHLFLSDHVNHQGNTNSVPRVEVHQPMTKFDFQNRGHPRCVDISYTDGIVAVGTNSGMVVIYSFKTFTNKGGVNGTNKLHFVMEIPAPPTALSVSSGTASGSATVTQSDHGYAVSSLKLVSQREVDGNASGSSKILSSTTSSPADVRTKLYVTYRRKHGSNGLETSRNNEESKEKTAFIHKSSKHTTAPGVSSKAGTVGGGGGVCCYDLGTIGSGASISSNASPSARYDLDGRDVLSSCFCDIVSTKKRTKRDSHAHNASSSTSLVGIDNNGEYADNFIVARSDGLYTYSPTDKISVSPIDGTKIAMCCVPPPPVARRRIYPKQNMNSLAVTAWNKSNGNFTSSGATTQDSALAVLKPSLPVTESGASYVLVATTDSKSGRDAVDVYDTNNKLVAFHVLLSPGHRALRATSTTTLPTIISDGATRGGLSSAVVLTSGGSIVTLTEKITSDKVSLLVQKNLYSAAISMAFDDLAYQPSDIAALYRRHAEHLYRKGDFSSAMDQYIYTIGTLEPSHVIFRFLDAPKIPLLVKYLQELRSHNIATPVQNELLKTCYLKLNNTEAAEKISASLSTTLDSSSCVSIVSSLLDNPTEALTNICSFEAPQAAEALVQHGATLARALPREMAGVVMSLCDGTYNPNVLADVAIESTSNNRNRRKSNAGNSYEGKLNKSSKGENLVVCDKYPVYLFSSAFLENPKLLRVILAHCFKNKCELNPSLKRTLLELTLEEWNGAKRTCDLELEKMRRGEAMAIITDPHANDIGDYEALVIVQLAGFLEGEVLLYERLQMAPMLLERYSKNGRGKSRRQMLAMCRSDPELLAEVLGHFVSMATDKISQEQGHRNNNFGGDDCSENSESEIGEMLDEIKEALSMARAQGVLPPVRVARILAGEGVGQFSNEITRSQRQSEGQSVPLSVALDYIGAILDESSKNAQRLKNEVEEYSLMCNSMQAEIHSLLTPLSTSTTTGFKSSEGMKKNLSNIDLEEMCARLSTAYTDETSERKTEKSSEEFWREISQSDDRFEAVVRFFARNIID